jgi:predicted HicB family RNase H-like nuclease
MDESTGDRSPGFEPGRGRLRTGSPCGPNFDSHAEVFGGTVVNANVLMSFEGKNVAELRKSFRDVVDTYLADCKAAGRQPEKPYNGAIIIRVDPEIHRRVAMKAAASRKSMNKYVQSLLEKATEDSLQDPRTPAAGTPAVHFGKFDLALIV